ncbi:MAG: hypothetical protein K0R84_2914 [Clostridia bacterium]|nr:hypothetical protein [Clostridia bacterium]
MHNFWAALLVLPIFTWYSMFTVLDRNYTLAQQDVENIVYQYTQIAAKKGILYEEVLEEMDKNLSKYGEHEIYISAESFSGDGEPERLEAWDVVDTDLREQGYDLINISVIYDERHPVSVMYEYSVFGTPNGETRNFSLFGKASSYIW